MSRAVIKSNLDNETLQQTLEKGFEEYPERDFEDGYHDYPNEEDSVDVSVDYVSAEDSISSDDQRRFNGEEVAFKSKVVKDIPDNENIEDTKANAEGSTVDKLEKFKNAKKGFTVQDMIAKNFQELLYAHHERVPGKVRENGKRMYTTKTKVKIGSMATQLGFNLINTLVGAGMLSLANGCYKMGIIGFTLWSVATIFYFIYTWNYYNKAIYLTGSSTMGELLSLIFGKNFSVIVDIFNSAFNMCILMSYQVIITQYLFGIIQDTTTRYQWNNTMAGCYGEPQRTAGVACDWHYILLYIVAICINLPFILPKSVKFLNKIAFLTIIAATFVTGVVVIKCIVAAAKGVSINGMGDKNIPTLKGKWLPSGAMDFFTMAPFITANFQIHSSLPPIYAGTKGISKKTKLKSLNYGSYVSIFACSAYFLLVGICGHISFDAVSSNILNDYSNVNSTEVDWLIIVCRMLMIVVVMSSYPALTFPTAAGIIRYIPKSWKISQIWKGRLVVYIVRFSILAITTFLAGFITNIGVIFSVAAALFSIPIVYICPMSIIMFWPRIKKFGNPEKRKLSVIDNLIYNKVVDGNQYFSDADVATALKMDVENVKEMEFNDVDPTVNNVNKEDRKDKDEPVDVVINVEKNVDGNEEIELYEVKTKEQREAEEQAKKAKEVQIPMDEEEVDIFKNKERAMKLPDAEISKWRYVVFITCMICCVILCILSVVGTLMDAFK